MKRLSQKPIDLDVANDTFYLEGGSLFRTKTYEEITGRTVRMASDKEDDHNNRYSTNRMIHAIKHQIPYFDYLVIDDDNKSVAISRTLMQVMNYKKTNKVQKTSWSKLGHFTRYVARWHNFDGKRRSKSFDTYDEAYAHHLKMMHTIWDKTFKRLNLYNTYFNQS